ncbi:MAG: Gfo/Idh/MocA family oxidoreductase [Chloroflexi bacterium]|nr:Gfo/Idh/MocA family oxidoreductase [Chloroflexota bacterium]
MNVEHQLRPLESEARVPLRIAVVGTGLLGERHARFWGQQDNVDLVGIVDLDLGRANRASERLATTFGIPRPPVFMSLDTLLASAAADAVSVATPDFAHRVPVVQALDAGLHVLVEKPLAMTTADAMVMADAARRAGRWLMVNHSMRWIPRYRAVHDAIRTGEWGQMVVAHSAKSDVIHVPTEMLRWASRSSAAYFLTAHDLDLVRWFTGDRIVRVFAQGARGVLDRRGIDAYDAIQSSVTFASGSIASFEASWIHPNTYPSFTDDYMHVICEKGVAYLDRGREGTEVFDTDRVRHPKHSTVYEQDGRIYGSFRHSLEHFTRSIRAGTEPLTSARRVMGVVSALEAIHRSLETGMPETVDDQPVY